jgi:hypothetical protein
MLHYRLGGRRRLGRPVKRLLEEAEQVYQGQTGEGLLLLYSSKFKYYRKR